MSVYVGFPFPTKNSTKWPYEAACHLVADSDVELIRFATGLGLRSSWIQYGSTTHFDLTPRKRTLAIEAGATPVDNHELVAWIRKKRAEKAKE